MWPANSTDDRDTRTGDTGDAATTTGDTGDAAIHGVSTRWLVGVRAWTLPAAWVKTPEVLVDDDDSRSSSRAHEHENFRLVSQLHVAIQTP